jgi:hypothetical protein
MVDERGGAGPSRVGDDFGPRAEKCVSNPSTEGGPLLDELARFFGPRVNVTGEWTIPLGFSARRWGVWWLIFDSLPKGDDATVLREGLEIGSAMKAQNRRLTIPRRGSVRELRLLDRIVYRIGRQTGAVPRSVPWSAGPYAFEELIDDRRRAS